VLQRLSESFGEKKQELGPARAGCLPMPEPGVRVTWAGQGLADESA
jgi:hypothetical protein